MATLSDLHLICGKRSARLPHQRAPKHRWRHLNQKGQKHHRNVLFSGWSKDTKQILCQSIFALPKKRPFTVNCLAVVALIHKLVMMTPHFYFHDTAAAVTDTKLHIGQQRMFGKRKPQISRTLRSVCKTIARGTVRRGRAKQERGV